MNKDLKVGLAVMLLILVGMFVFFAMRSGQTTEPTGEDGKQARGNTPPAETTTKAPEKKSGGADPVGEYLKAGKEAKKADDLTGLTMRGVTKGTDPDFIEEIESEAFTPEARRTDPVPPIDPLTDPLSPVLDPTHTGVTPPVTPASYVVKMGDVLSEISKKVYGSSKHWQLIAEANNITDPATQLRPEMVLRIPPLPEADAAALAPVRAPAAGERVHVVAESDTLSQISDKYYGTSRHWRLIAEANRIAEGDLLRVGSRLRIPALPEGTAVAPMRPAPGAGEQEYVVKEGDTLQEISAQFYGSVRFHELIQRANNIADPRGLRAGQRLIIPARPESTTTPAGGRESLEPRLDPGERRYVVQAGETLSEIASKELGSRIYYPDIMKRNNMTDARNVREGQVLVIPSLSTLRRASTVIPE